MGLIELIVILVVVGVIMYLVNTFIPMEGKIKTLLNVAVVIFLVIWLLQAFGLFGIGDLRIGR